MNKPAITIAFATLALATLAAAAATAQEGQYCREYQQTITIAGKTQHGYGTACLQPDGSWELQNSHPATQRVVEEGAPVSVAPDNIEYVAEEGHVFITPPEPFVVGTVFIGGHSRHFGPDFRPYHHWH